MKKSEKICCILALICLIPGVFLQCVYTAMRFTGFLFCCTAAVLIIFALLTHWKDKKRWVLWLRRIFSALIAAGFLLFAVLEIWVISCSRTDNETPVTAVIVLGAGVNGTQPSLSLETRLQAALAYIQDKPDIPVIVTGAQGRGESISEARCMSDWLTAQGVPAERILLEEQATSTKENIWYSLEILSRRGMDTTANIAVVSSDYHLCRTSLYMPGNMVPVAAHMPVKYLPLTINYYIREAFGIAAAIVFR